MTERSGAVGLRPSAEAAWAQLRADVDLQPGFWLAFLFGAEAPEVREMVARTRDLVRAEARRVDVLPAVGRVEVAEILVELLTPQPADLAVTWLTDAGPAPDRDQTWTALLRRLNERRDVLRSARPSGLVVTCPAGLLPTVRDQAPDLWGFRATAVALDDPRTPPPLAVKDVSAVIGVGTVATAEATTAPEAGTSPLTPVRGTPIRASELVGRRLARAARALRSGALAEALTEARSALDTAATPDDTVLARAWLARAHAAAGNAAEATRHARTALTAQRPLEEETTTALLAILVGGPDLDERIDAAAGLVTMRRVMVERRPDSPTARDEAVAALRTLGDVQTERGHLADALTAYQEAVALLRGHVAHRTPADPPPEARSLIRVESEIPTLRLLSSALNDVGRTRRSLGHLDAALDAFREAVALRREVVVHTGEAVWTLRDLSVSLDHVGGVYRDLGLLELAMACFTESLTLTDRVHRHALDDERPRTLRDLSVALDRLGDVESDRGDHAQAARYYSESLRLTQILLDLTGETEDTLRDLALAHSNVGTVERAQGRYDEALRHYLESLALHLRVLDLSGGSAAAQRDLSVALDDVGGLERDRGRLDDARARFAESLDLRRDVLARTAPTPEALRDLSVALINLGTAAHDGDRLDDALAQYTEALDIRRGILADTQETPEALRDVTTALNLVGRVERDRGQLDVAAARYAEALALTRRVVALTGRLPRSLRDLSVAVENTGTVERDRGLLDAALRSFTECRSLDEEVLVATGDTPEALRDLSVVLGHLAEVQEARGDLAAATAAGQQSLDLARRVLDAYGDSPTALSDLSRAAAALALFTEAGADHDRALALAREALAAAVRREELFGEPYVDRELIADLRARVARSGGSAR